jgi:phosphoglycolate phosphatase-like HAD superfamily hydrolase
MNENPFRAELASEIKKSPKESRSEILESAQASVDYWQAKTEKLGQFADWSEDRTELSWKNKNVYHGSTVPEIESFEFAKESTIGNKAMYFTIDPALAMGYAKLRSEERSDGEAHLYEVGLSDIRLQNWAQLETVSILKEKLITYLEQVIQEIKDEAYERFAQKYGIQPKIKESTVLNAINDTMERIKQEGFLHEGNIKNVASGIPGIFFQNFVEQNGFDGVITWEGGDDPIRTTKPGISVVVYNPEKISWQKPYSLEERAE